MKTVTHISQWVSNICSPHALRAILGCIKLFVLKELTYSFNDRFAVAEGLEFCERVLVSCHAAAIDKANADAPRKTRI